MLDRTPIRSQERFFDTTDKKKKNYTQFLAVMILVAIWYVFIGKDLLLQNRLQGAIEGPQKVYYEFTCSEANLAKLIGTTWKAEEDATVENSVDEAEEDTLWYQKYYTKLETLGVTTLKAENAFNALTSERLAEVLYELTGKEILIEENSQLQLYMVLQCYEAILQESNQDLQYQILTILATPSDDENLSAWQVATNKGQFWFEGLVLEPLKNKTVQVAYIGDEILGITEIISNRCVIEHCKVSAVEEEKATIEIANLELNYTHKILQSEDVGKMGTVTIEEDQLIQFVAEGETQLETVSSNSNQEMSSKAIRVLLSSQKEGYVQNEVTLSSNQEYEIQYGTTTTTLKAGDTWKASQFNWGKDVDTVQIIPKTQGSQIKIESIQKGSCAPSYLGCIEITKVEQGYQVVNEVDLESYVAGVLPSEMPTSYGIEALKAQAVAVRTYGMACIESNKFASYGADVDDTTASQVYNQTPTNEIAIDAAKQTAGLVIKSDGKLISNKFFATSCGYTANSGEVWAGQVFPSQTPTYLVSRQQYLGDELISNLKDEERFKEFIQLDAEDLDAFDEASPWFRWQVNLTGEEAVKLIQPALSKLASQYSGLITVKSMEGESLNAVSHLGNLCNIEVLERGEGGNIMRLELQFESGKCIIETEYLIRSLFASNSEQELTVTRSNQTIVGKMTLLPSAFFTVEQSKDDEGKLTHLTLIGGGNGHGVGLSQDGANGMAERGYSYKEILLHYYSDCEILQG